MAGKTSIRGLNETIQKLRDLGARADVEIENGLILGGEVIAVYARQNIVEHDLVDTSNMLLSTGVSEPYRRGTIISVDVGSGAEYGIYHEFGTVHHPAREWLLPAFYSGEDEALDEFKHSIEAAVKSVI